MFVVEIRCGLMSFENDCILFLFTFTPPPNFCGIAFVLLKWISVKGEQRSNSQSFIKELKSFC